MKTLGATSALEPYTEIALDDLLSTLPEALSYSRLRLPDTYVFLARRDLFDARFQVIAAEDAGREKLAFLDAPSDLVPGKYEGGLKTWECSVDLAAYLESSVCKGDGSWVRGKHILELGCGTAVPSLLLFSRLLEALAKEPAQNDTASTILHLQDYNRSVLELVTLPNVLLTWYTSPLAEAYRASEDLADPDTDDADLHLSITPYLVTAFKTSLSTHNISLHFFSGSWDGFPTSTSYDCVLTSETIYREESIPPLLQVLRESKADTCLVAAKVLYFGVGGGVQEFVKAVEKQDGKVEDVWDQREGVARKIMSVHWS
ncbi:hypothetical protein PENSPDRAFT_626633 [Peniophora sp. CONT]|nr:hypothetical protein PENSPDRAFT_626633 [Peniophora sp. CONT]